MEGDAYEGTALGLLQSGGMAALEGRVVVTEYNNMPYLVRWAPRVQHVTAS